MCLFTIQMLNGNTFVVDYGHNGRLKRQSVIFKWHMYPVYQSQANLAYISEYCSGAQCAQ